MKKINSLPEEIFLEIFEYLNDYDVLNLSRTCKCFHELITKSKPLASKLTVCFEKRRQYCLIGRRKYTKLRVSYIDPAIHFALTRLLGDDITRLSFDSYEFTLDVVRRVLLLCKNVKFLKFEEIKRLHGIADCDMTRLPKHKNLEIETINCDPRVYKILRNCTARRILMSCPEFALRHFFLDFQAFLKDQTELVELQLHEFIGPLVSIGIILFGSDILTEVNFKLKSLEYKMNELVPYGNMSSDVFFDSFMDAHKETLEVLKVDRLEDFDFTNYLQDCKSLRHLSVGEGTIISSKQSLPTVTSLELEYQRMNLLRATPNIRELKINSHFDDPHADFLKWHLLSRCPLLEKLEVEDLPMDDFPIVPSLKSLKLSQMLHIDSEVFSRNPQIEELTFVMCHELGRRKSKVLKIIVGYLNELKSLTIVSSTKIDPSAIKYVKTKCTKLKQFRVYGDVERDFVRIY